MVIIGKHSIPPKESEIQCLRIRILFLSNDLHGEILVLFMMLWSQILCLLTISLILQKLQLSNCKLSSHFVFCIRSENKTQKTTISFFFSGMLMRLETSSREKWQQVWANTRDHSLVNETELACWMKQTMLINSWENRFSPFSVGVLWQVS